MARHELDIPWNRVEAPETSVWARRYRCEWGEVVGSRVRRRRSDLGWILADFCRRVPRADGAMYSQGFFSRLERGWASPPLWVYIQLARALEVHPGRLLGFDDFQKDVSEGEMAVVRLMRRRKIAPEDAIERLLVPHV